MAIKQENKLFRSKDIQDMIYGTEEQKEKILNIMVQVLNRRSELNVELKKIDSDSKFARMALINWIQENGEIQLDSGYVILVDYFKGHAYLKVNQAENDYE